MDLQRFVTAQDEGDTYAQARAELEAGRKTSHWMWFVFPQIAGLGRSGMARAYAIANLDEARSYLAHPVLGPRLIECGTLVAAHPDRTAEQIFGTTDAMKLRSSMTLFAAAAGDDDSVFTDVLEKFFPSPDQATLDRL